MSEVIARIVKTDTRRIKALTVVGVIAAVSVPHAIQHRDAMPPLILESISGRDSFEFYCSSCHGTGGKGDGPAAQGLKRRPTDLTSLARRNNGAFPRAHVLDVVAGASGNSLVSAHGSSEMPVWGPIFRALDSSDVRVRHRLDNLIAHVESLQAPTSGTDALGARLFKTHCASCHGETGRGNGPLADDLRRTPPDLTQFTARNGGAFPSERLARIIDGRDVSSHGDRDMPVWGDVFKRLPEEGSAMEAVKARTEAIVRYLQAIQQRAV